MSFRDYSTAPASNTTLADGTYVGPNMLRNKVRPALQQIMADGKALADEFDNLPAIAKGDPGGNVMSTGAFTALSNMEIPDGTDIIRTSAYGANGKGAAFYRRRPDLTADDVADNPLWMTTTLAEDGSAGDVFALDEIKVDPYMFGGYGTATGAWNLYTPDPDDPVVPFEAWQFEREYDADSDLAPDDTNACQAALDYQFMNFGAHADFSGGDWGITGTLYACFPSYGLPSGRTITWGHFYLLPAFQGDAVIARNAFTGDTVYENDVILIGGTDLTMNGTLFIDGTTGVYRLLYEDRRARGGVRFLQANGSQFDSIFVDGVTGDAVALDDSDTEVTVREGTPYEVTYGYSNNIGLRGRKVFGRGIGMSHALNPTITDQYKTYTALQGGVDTLDDDLPWVAGAGSFGNTLSQRSRLTVDDTSEYRVGDTGRIQKSWTNSTYGTYTWDHTNHKMTWTAGNPVTEGWYVGMRFQPHIGANGYKIFTVKAFGGTSNREISVEETVQIDATVYGSGDDAEYHLIETAPSYHVITAIRSATEFEIFPWAPGHSQNAGTWKSHHGCVLNPGGGNTASTHFHMVGSFGAGTVLRLAGLYGTKVDVLLAEYADVGIVYGATPYSISYGNEVGMVHSEGVKADLIQVTAQVSQLVIHALSAYNIAQIDNPFGLSHALNSRVLVTDDEQTARPLSGVTITTAYGTINTGIGQSYTSGENLTEENDLYVSNSIGRNDKMIRKDDFVIDLVWNDDVAKAAGEMNRAKVLWTGPTAGDPTGSGVFRVPQTMTRKGWEIRGGIAGAGAHAAFSSVLTVTAPTTSLEFNILFDKATKRIDILQRALGA